LSKRLIVITGLELGWDCVVGVFDSPQAVLDSWINTELDEPHENFDALVESLHGEYVLHYETLNQ